MALTAEVLFVNVDYLKRLTNLNGSVEADYVVPSVILAQDKYLQQYLGTDLYVYLKTNIMALTGVYLTLMDSYIRKATCWWTMVELIPDLYVRLDNGGLAIRSAENTIQITENDLHREIERARQNAQFYTERLVAYLKDNSSNLPEYSTNQAPDMKPTRTAYNQNGFTTSHGTDGRFYKTYGRFYKTYDNECC